jgi:pyrimidine 5'-nucleotidase
MSDVLGFKSDDIPEIRKRFLKDHGTTLKGLQIHYQVDPSDYLAFVHNLPLQDFLSVDVELHNLLKSIPHHRWIFTNADLDHALRVISILGILDCFKGIIDIWRLNPYCKPEQGAYSLAMDIAGSKTPAQCAFIDDSPENLTAARKMGLFTVQIGRNSDSSIADRQMETIHELPKIVPEFWRMD